MSGAIHGPELDLMERLKRSLRPPASQCETCEGEKRVVVEPEPGFDTKVPEYKPCPDCTRA